MNTISFIEFLSLLKAVMVCGFNICYILNIIIIEKTLLMGNTLLWLYKMAYKTDPPSSTKMLRLTLH